MSKSGQESGEVVRGGVVQGGAVQGGVVQGGSAQDGVVTGQPMGPNDSAAGGNLPAGWQTAYDNQGRPYYVNYNMSPPTTQYENPAMMFNHPPPPPMYGHGGGGGGGGTVIMVQRGGPAFAMESEREEQLDQIRQFGKHISCFGCLDFVFAFFMFEQGIFFVLLYALGPLCGMIGGMQYRPPLIFVYMVFLVFKIMLTIWSLFSQPEFAFESIFLFLSILLYMYILRIVGTFYRLLKSLTAEDTELIRQMGR